MNSIQISASGTPDDFVSLQVGSSTCFYVSTTTIWPYPDGTSKSNQAVDNCNKMNLELATIDNENERVALRNLLSKNSNYLDLALINLNLAPIDMYLAAFDQNLATFDLDLPRFQSSTGGSFCAIYSNPLMGNYCQ